MDNYYDKVIAKEEEQSSLIKRMITDRDLLYLSKYKLSDIKGVAVPDIINVTLNKPAIFAANVISALGGTSQQTNVTSNKHSIDPHKVEEFLEAAFNAADALAHGRRQRSLNSFADGQFCIRGRAARRVLFRTATDKDVKNGWRLNELIPDIRGWDTHYVTFEDDGEREMEWGAYHINRNWARTEKDYGELMVKYGVKRKDEKAGKANVVDVWTKDHNEVWIEGKQVLEQPHNYGFCPVIIEIVPLGYGDIIIDENSMEHEGESIFFLIRDVIPELNRLVSLLTTLNQSQLLAGMKYKNPDGTPQDEPPDRPRSMDMVSLGKGDLELIDYGDARRSAEMVYSILEKALQQGSISDIDLGNLNFPLSAVALVKVGEGRDQLYLPRLNSKALLNQKTSEMIVKQVLQIGGTVELGTPGHKESFDTSKLEGEYETTYKYFVKSPAIDIARLTMGDQALKMGIDRETVYTDIIQYEDPKGMIQKYYYELAEKLSPNVLMNRTIIKLLEMAERDGDADAARDAQIMAAELGLSLDQIQQGVVQPPPQVPQNGGSPALPLLGESGKVGGVKPAPAEMPALEA